MDNDEDNDDEELPDFRTLNMKTEYVHPFMNHDSGRTFFFLNDNINNTYNTIHSVNGLEFNLNPNPSVS